MTYAILPLTEDPWQVFMVDLTINGDPFHAQVEIRYLPAPDQWYRYAVKKLEQFIYRNDISVILVDLGAEKVVEEYLVKMDRRVTNEDVFYKVEEKTQEGDDGDVRSGLFDRPTII